jgi:chloramphenicol-sensitive protein RarD
VSTSGRSSGVAAGIGSYFLWGFLPLYFVTLGSTGSWEIVSWRILWSLVFCVGILAVTKQLRSTIAVLRDPKLLWYTLAAGVLIYINWQFYIIANLTGHIVEGSLGYFINPLVTILLGVLVLGEKLRPLQWVAIGFAAVAVTILVAGYGQFPWFAFILAGSFATYGLVKNRVGGRLNATQSLTIETAWLVPVAVVLVTVESVAGGLNFGHGDLWSTVLLIGLGPVTAIPLLLFGFAASKVPLSWLGFMQYVAPTLQFLIGVFVMNEPMPPIRLLGFALVWVGLLVLMVDAVVRNRRQAALNRA